MGDLVQLGDFRGAAASPIEPLSDEQKNQLLALGKSLDKEAEVVEHSNHDVSIIQIVKPIDEDSHRTYFLITKTQDKSGVYNYTFTPSTRPNIQSNTVNFDCLMKVARYYVTQKMQACSKLKLRVVT